MGRKKTNFDSKVINVRLMMNVCWIDSELMMMRKCWMYKKKMIFFNETQLRKDIREKYIYIYKQ